MYDIIANLKIPWLSITYTLIIMLYDMYVEGTAIKYSVGSPPKSVTKTIKD